MQNSLKHRETCIAVQKSFSIEVLNTSCARSTPQGFWTSHKQSVLRDDPTLTRAEIPPDPRPTFHSGRGWAIRHRWVPSYGCR